MRAWLLHAALPPLLTLAAVLGFTGVGDVTAEALRADRPQRLAFNDIDVDPPPGLTRPEFLAEVQYISDLPDACTLDNDCLPHLESAFARHAWVEKVERIELRRHRPPLVQLRYRRAVLVVDYHGHKCPVDRRGVLLPRAAARPELPAYRGRAAPPPATGARWADERVLACAVVLGYVAADEPGVESVTVDRRGVVLRQKGGAEVVWGRPPGDEANEEASATVKRRRWREDRARLSKGTLDLRPAAAALMKGHL